MRKPPLTFETFVTALAVLGVGASSACSKAPAASVGPEPPAAAAPASPPPGAPPSPEPAAQPAQSEEAKAGKAPAPKLEDKDKRTEPAATATTPARSAAAPAVGATAVDGGRPGAAKDGLNKKPKSQMSCGANGCSPDMKKGGN